MPATKNILAFDLGAESGRALIGRFDGALIHLDVVHRFANIPVQTLDALHWDVLYLYQEMIAGMRLARGVVGGGELASLGVDTWGVDFALLGRGGTLLGNPRHYRDPHTEGMMERTFARMPRDEIFRHTGIQFMRFNSLYQLLAMAANRSPLLEHAENLLFIPDLFHYWFTGVLANEYTDASTSQLLDARSRRWAWDVIRKFDFHERIFGTIVPPGTVLGALRKSVAEQTGLGSIPVIAPATHDTAAAVAAVPARGDSWAYISSGTWSLMGAETREPQCGGKALQYNFTNEGGVDGSYRLLKNIMGLWLVQECRRVWERAGTTYTYEDLTKLAEQAPPFVSVINPDDASFMLPPSMPEAIAAFCQKTRQPIPQGPGPVVRCALEGLAFKYRLVLERLEELVGRRLETVHVVGGGSQNTLLCQLTADACNRPVIAGPVEATALGNILTQAIGLGLVQSLEQGRDVVRRSCEPRTYTPHRPQDWHEPYERFLRV